MQFGNNKTGTEKFYAFIQNSTNFDIMEQGKKAVLLSGKMSGFFPVASVYSILIAKGKI